MIHTLKHMQDKLQPNEEIHILMTDEHVQTCDKNTIITPTDAFVSIDNRITLRIINPQHVIKMWICKKEDYS